MFVTFWQAEGEGLQFTLENVPAIRIKDIPFHGKIRSDATECVVSFPVKPDFGWDALIDERYEQSVACVWGFTPEDGLGKHSTDPEAPPEARVTCYCPTIYGQRPFNEFGYLHVLRKGYDREEEQKARQKAECKNAVVVREDANKEEMAEAKRRAEEAWERSGKTASWGCRWFEVWKDRVHQAVALGQTLKVVFFPSQVGKGIEAWDDLSLCANLWDGVGCEGDQKIQIAYLEEMRKHNPGKGWKYKSVDLINFLKKHFQPGTRVLARDGDQWRRGTLLSYPTFTKQQSTFMTVQCEVECLETEKVFSSERVRLADAIIA